MSSDLGSLDEVMRDDDLCSALSERRLDDVPFGDELGVELASWCDSLDFDHPAQTAASAAELAATAARRRSVRLAGRSVAVAAAVAAVCVGGLMISKFSVGDDDYRPGDRPGVTTVDSNDVQSPSLQTRSRIWNELRDARTALVEHRWADAARLLAAARRQLPGVEQDDGRAGLNIWLTELSSALDHRASLSTTSALGPAFGPYTIYSGVPMPPGMTAPPSSMPPGTGTLPPPLPSMPPSDPTSAPPSSSMPPDSSPSGPPAGGNPPSGGDPSTSPSTSPSPSGSPTESPSASPTLPSGPTYSSDPTWLPPDLFPSEAAS